MQINRENALALWRERYGYNTLVKDFHGNTMYRDAYGDRDASLMGSGTKCGWNIHHIVPLANGGTNEKSNLLCTNIVTNSTAADKTTFWIDDKQYQVRKNPRTGQHEIIKIQS